MEHIADDPDAFAKVMQLSHRIMKIDDKRNKIHRELWHHITDYTGCQLCK